MNGVSKISVSEDVTLITFHQIPSDTSMIAGIFTDFAESGINIDMISQTAPQGRHIEMSFTLPAQGLIKVLELVNRFREKHAELKPMVSNGNCKIQLYGEEMREAFGVAARAVAAVARAETDLTLITTSEVDISLLIPQARCEETLLALEETFGVKADR